MSLVNRCAIFGLFCVLAVSAVDARAQTDVSLRIRSLGTAFSGILDDYLTDAFLNPARTAALDGSMAYGARLPARTVEVQTPGINRFGITNPPIENVFLRFTLEPIVLGYFRSEPGRGALSLVFETYVSNVDRLNDRESLSFSSSSTRTSFEESASATDTRHYVADLSAVTASTGTRLGFRLRVLYEEHVLQNGFADVDVGASVTNPVDTERRVFSRISADRFERTAVRAEIGITGDGGTLRDIVVGAGLLRELFNTSFREVSISDDDADGNGIALGGGIPRLLRNLESYGSSRDYRGYGASARAHLQHGNGLRSTYVAAWSMTDGDGSGAFQFDDESLGFMDEQRNAGAHYFYDGDIESFHAEASVGSSREIVPAVMVAAAVRGSYSLARFDEGGQGNASLSFGGFDSPLDTTFNSPYEQRHDNETEIFELTLPVAVEWRFHTYAGLRVGVDFTARHEDRERAVARDIPALAGTSFGFAAAGRPVRDVRLQTKAEAVFNSGLGINVRDRFTLDLLASVSSASVDLARFVYLAARYHF